MSGGEITAIVIVAIVMCASIITRRMQYLSRRETGEPLRAENQQLRDEVQQLKERMKVLERITVEKENSLAKEIESLRDR